MTRPRRVPTPRPPTLRPVAEPLEGRAYFTSPLIFAAPASYAAGTDPADLAAADLNGDGRLDVVTADYGDGKVSVLLGNGNGTFQDAVSYPVTDPVQNISVDPQSIAVGDLNGDGRPDVVVVGNAADFVFVLMNNGDGTLAPAKAYAVGTRPEAVVLADLTGKGPLDIATADQGSGTVSVLTNAGDGTFAPAVQYVGGPGPDALAAADLNGDGHVDLVTVSPDDNTVRVLLNRGNGTFPLDPPAYDLGASGRGITIADTDNNARPDLIVTLLRSTAVAVLPNEGDGTFGTVNTHVTGGFPFATAVADLNGDNRPDLVTADSRAAGVGVLVHNITGGFNAHRRFPIGLNAGSISDVASPEAVVTADLDGDGRPDIITADFNDNAIGVLLNRTVFPPLTLTTLTLTPALNPVAQGDPLTLTAQLTPAPDPKFAAARVVQFLAGAKVLGRAPLLSDGTARLTTTALPVGTTTVVARFTGNAGYAPSSTALDETVLTRAAAAPLVAPTAATVFGDATAPFVPGDVAVALVTLTNVGPGRATGAVAVSLSIAPAGDAAAARAVTTVGPTTFAVDLRGAHSRTVPVRFALPTDLTAGGYTVAAALAPARALTAEQVSATPTASAAIPVQLAFGAVGAHPHLALTTTLSTGATVRLSIAGPGSGTVVDAGNGGIVLGVAGTTPGSVLTVAPVSGGAVTIVNLVDQTALGRLNAPGVVLGGLVYLAAGIRGMTVAGADGAAIVLGAFARAALSLGVVTDTSLVATGAVKSLSVASWSADAADSVTAVGLTGALTSAGDFGARLSLTGTRVPVGRVDIAGTLASPTWLISSAVGPITAGSVAAGFSGSIAGPVASLTVAGNFAGVLAARTFGDVVIGGDLTGATLLAGATLGPAVTLGGGDDAFNAGRIASVRIGGGVTGSLVAAGFRPASDAPFTPIGGTLIRGGAMGPIVIGGAVDAASLFAAASLPATASVGGATVSTAGDPRFD